MTDLHKIRAAQVCAAEQAAIADLPPELLASVAPEVQAPEGAQLPNVAKTAPAKIHLVIGAGCPPEADFTDCDEVTWCKDKVDANSITYIRADLAAQPQAERDNAAFERGYQHGRQQERQILAAQPAPDLCPASGLWCAGSCTKPAPAEDQPQHCQGANCRKGRGSSEHSAECIAEAAASQGWAEPAPAEGDDTGWLHVRGQFSWHGEAAIAGTRAGLELLRAQIETALSAGSETQGTYVASDGEGYELAVEVLSDDAFAKSQPSYIQEACDKDSAYWKQRAFDAEAKLHQASKAQPKGTSEYTEVDDKLLTGQAQHLIGALMNHGLLPGKTLPEDKYLKLWDVVKAQLRAVHREAVRAAQAPAWVWNPARTAWEAVHVSGHWQEGALYAFGPLPEPLAGPATAPAPEARALIEQCRDALAEELAAWDIDPPLHHVKTAHDACEAWLQGQAPAVAQRQPMSTAQMVRLWDQVEGTRNGYGPLIRAVERHHGIDQPDVPVQPTGGQQ